MKVYNVTDPEFARYGRVVEGYDFTGLIAELKKIPMPAEGVEYVASAPALEALPVFREFEKRFYGGMPAELGYCGGHNDALNGLEYHRGSEVNVAVTDFVALLGLLQDLEEDCRYDTGKIEAFYVPAGLAVEFYATTLHYCACNVKPEGYMHGTFLPKGTNTPLEGDYAPVTEEDRLLQEKNKWLLAHPEGGLKPQVPVKLYGKNWTIRDCELE